MKILQPAKPTLLLSVLDGASFEHRILRLLDRRKPWPKRGRIASALACTVAITIVSGLSMAIGIRPVAAMGAQASAQNAPTKVPSFDAVSIREAKSSQPLPEVWGLRADGYHWSGVPLIALIMTAYPPSQGSTTDMFTPDELINIPDWMLHHFYDVDVKVADTDVAAWKQPDLRKAMLQAMLADRLKLAAHYSHKPGLAYELHIAKGGVRFKQADAGHLRSAGVQGGHPLDSLTMAQLCRDLRHMAGRPVIDKTGLTGQYDLVLQLDPPGANTSPSDALDRVTYALEQLGLKLVPVKAPVETLVIDHADPPTAN